MVNSFILVKDLGQELILGTPFITQSYPSKGLESKALEKKIKFNFLPHIRISEINNSQKNTIIQSISVLNYKEKKNFFFEGRNFIQKKRRIDSK